MTSNTTFVVATNNADKLKEIREILASAHCGCISLQEAGIFIEIDETGQTFEDNAYIKAKAIFDLCRRPVVADDSGLCVDALDGEPGVHTARYAGDGHDHDANINKLLANLKGLPLEERTGRFVSCVCAILEDGRVVTARGECEGVIGTERRGTNGFGYDPVFWMRGNRSMAELSDERKNMVSHRARAIRKLAFKLRGIKKVKN